MPKTALQHFEQDIARAKAIVAHVGLLPQFAEVQKYLVKSVDAELELDPAIDHAELSLRSDLLRSAWMFSVGALDAYFCDAYTDIIAATAASKCRQNEIELPDWAYEIKFPLRAVLEQYDNENWRWRMAARKMMERENFTSLQKIESLFNRFFRKGSKFFRDCLDAWMSRPDAKIRLFGISAVEYQSKNSSERHVARDSAILQFQERFEKIFQRRHDCIHNCDRPRVSPQPLDKGGTVLKVIQDIEFLVYRCEEHIKVEFREFLIARGCSVTTIKQAGY